MSGFADPVTLVIDIDKETFHECASVINFL